MKHDPMASDAGSTWHGRYSGLRFLVTAGPTREAIDPVRYISNHSSGKMGYALANYLHDAGAHVILISGPTSLQSRVPAAQIERVESAMEMFHAARRHFAHVDAAIFAAAVADYRPAEISPSKIKKSGDELLIRLIPNPDIAAAFGRVKTRDQVSIGFALETDDILANARKKMRQKGFDFIVANSAIEPGAGFGSDTNRITIIDKTGRAHAYGTKTKDEVARDIIEHAFAQQLEMVI